MVAKGGRQRRCVALPVLALTTTSARRPLSSDSVVTIIAKRVTHCAENSIPSLVDDGEIDFVCTIDVLRIVTTSPSQVITTGPAVQRVRTGTPDQDIISRVADQLIVRVVANAKYCIPRQFGALSPKRTSPLSLPFMTSLPAPPYNSS